MAFPAVLAGPGNKAPSLTSTTKQTAESGGSRGGIAFAPRINISSPLALSGGLANRPFLKLDNNIIIAGGIVGVVALIVVLRLLR